MKERWVGEVKEVGWAKSKERAQPKGKKEMGPKNKAHSHLINNLIMEIKNNNNKLIISLLLNNIK